MHELVRHCFKVRKMTFWPLLKELAGSDEQSAFRSLRHYIGRLGEHLRAAEKLVSAALRMPCLLDNFRIMAKRSSCSLRSPLAPERMDLHGIIGRAFQSEKDIAKYRDLISSMNEITGGGLLRGIKDRCSFLTRVHAELLLVDLFQEPGFDFVAGDRYIGCSKSACYCCYHYISALRGGFSLSSRSLPSMPACHNNLYLRWRAPDVPKSRGEAAVKSRELALNTMLKDIRADLQRQMDSKAPPRSSQFDSLTGVTSLRERELPEIGNDEPSSPEEGDGGYYPKLLDTIPTNTDSAKKAVLMTNPLLSGQGPPRLLCLKDPDVICRRSTWLMLHRRIKTTQIRVGSWNLPTDLTVEVCGFLNRGDQDPRHRKRFQRKGQLCSAFGLRGDL